MLTVEEMEMYHQDNPQVYEAFENFTMQVIASGRKYFSGRAIFERIRWHSQIEAKNDTFKINDHQVPFYARLFEEKHPQYKGFFKKRRSVADDRKEVPHEENRPLDIIDRSNWV